MKRTFLLKMMLLLCALVAGSSSVWGEDRVFSLVTNESQLAADANYIIASGIDGACSVMGGANSNTNRKALSATASSGVITLSDVATSASDTNKPHVIQLKGSTGAWNLYDVAEKNYLNGGYKTTKNQNHLKVGDLVTTTGEVNNGVYTITINGDNNQAEITNQNNFSVRLNGTIFATYSSGQSPVYLYKESAASAASVPSFSVAEGTYTTPQSVTISSNGAAQIWYTTDGTDPMADGVTPTKITGTSTIVTVNTGMSIWARAFDGSSVATAIAKASYVIKPSAPVILPAERSYSGTTNVSFTQTENASVYYTDDETEPTASSTLYDGTPFAITTNVTIKAIAIDAYGNESDITTAAFKNSDLQNTDISVTTDYTWLGSSKGSNLSSLPQVIDCEGVTVTFNGSGTKPRGDEGYIRMYASNTMTFTAPTNYLIKEIVFTKANNKWDNSFNVTAGVWNNDNLKWSGLAQEVTLTETGSSGNNQFSQIEIKLVASKDITITTATWASFSCDKALDFTGTGVTAYIAKVKDDSNVTLTEITKVPANTGIVVNAPAETYAIPVLSGDADDTTGNLLKPWLTAGEPTETTYYTLAVSGGEPVFYTSTGGVLAANKAYLVMPGNVTAPSLGVFFGGTTGMNDVRSKTEEVRSDFYNLNGQRVSNPTKGLYIVNGKKYIVK